MRILKGLLAALISAAMLLIVAGLVALRWPGILFTESTLSRLARIAERATGARLSWERAQVTVISHSWLDKSFRLAFSGLCIRRDADHACFRDALLGARIDFAKLRPRVLELGPIRLAGGDVGLVIPPSETRPHERGKPPLPPPGIRLPERWLIQPRLHPVHIELARARVSDGSSRYQGALSLDLADDAAGNPAGKLRLRARLDETLLSADGELALRAGPGARSRGAWLEHTLRARLESGGTRLIGQLQGGFGPSEVRQRLEVRWDERASGASRWIPRASATGCELRFLAHATRVTCPVRTPLPLPRSPWIRRLQPPSRAGATVTAELAPTGFPPDLSRPLKGHVAIAFEPLANALIEGTGGIRGEFHGTPARFPEDWRYEAELGVRLRVTRFEELVARLRQTRWAIPAPFHALEGSLELRADGRTDLMRGEIPLSLCTRLSSRTQKLDIDAGATLRLGALARWRDRSGSRQAGRVPGPHAPRPDAELSARAVLSQVRLELPRLQLEAPPPLLADPRIVPTRTFRERADQWKRTGEQSAPPSFAYDIEVATPSGRPLELLSNLAREPVPVRVRLRLSDSAPMEGELAVERVGLRVLRRKARLESFGLRLASPIDESPVDGLIRVTYADYTITIRVLGTAGAPTIRLLSDPPLPEEQLVAVLLFGKPIEELDPDQSESVGSARSAFADGALSLASLYVLASTPIQSIGYDPRSRELSVKLRLGAGTSLTLGSSGGELREIGIRKRLGPHWTITTDLSHRAQTPGAADPSEAPQRTASAFLEWHHRY
ncbi:MAG: translocation/assembly module TamB domain-containing protein [Oligoflexia bacterium]|nr:translocation/assembly module TamB domain-containing protein [Oligoflexia bacterium]